VDYALRAVVELVSSAGDSNGPVTAEQLANARASRPKFLESILLQLRRGGVVNAQRGPDGGLLAGPGRPRTISLAGRHPGDRRPAGQTCAEHRPRRWATRGAAQALQEVWIALRASEREILELVTIADVAAASCPTASASWPPIRRLGLTNGGPPRNGGRGVP